MTDLLHGPRWPIAEHFRPKRCGRVVAEEVLGAWLWFPSHGDEPNVVALHVWASLDEWQTTHIPPEEALALSCEGEA
jgi:hypothetical protein